MIDLRDEAALLQAARQNDEVAFRALVEPHGQSLKVLCYRMLGSFLDAEDATQETLVRAYRALARYQERQQFRTWLFQILVNRCRTIMRRRQHRARFFVVDDDVVRRAPGPPLIDTEIGDDLRGAIATLDTQLREAFLLKHVEQLSYDEMHAITGASVPALKMRVKRACERLRTALRQATDA